ncbi:hypothetical protein WICMUC_000891 [Wickerhamomyces mucosus]|uniref:Uncharacterized protein n=1 Tax=Wickerhamomyces mucosus TaxID=1378264 RepID=A0A9P8PW73_9ASCO|nr:hypothetical protein WICMUC_000891 [Wickerhamomyces mucosus]
MSTTSSLGLPSVKLANPAQSLNLLAFLNVNDACLQSDQWTYSSLVIFLVLSSAAFSLFSEATVASLSDSSNSSLSSSKGCSENINCSSQGSLILDFFILVRSFGFLLLVFKESSIRSAPSTPPASWSFAFLRTSFQDK